MKINWFKLYISIMLFVLVGIFAYSEYRMTINQDLNTREKIAKDCYSGNNSKEEKDECFKGAKRFLIWDK